VSVHVESWVWGQEVGDPNAKLVLVKIAQNASDEGDHAFPGVERISRETELGKRTVVRKIAYLIEHGWLAKERRATELGYRKTNSYSFPRYQAEKGLSAKPASRAESPSATDDSLSAAVTPKQSVERSVPPSETSSPRVRTPLDDLWDAFAEHVQQPPTTPSQRSGYAKLVREALADGWTPEKVEAVARAYHEHETLGDTMLTLAALLKWAPVLEATPSNAIDLKAHMEATRRRFADGHGTTT
jgi:hypothetical protein